MPSGDETHAKGPYFRDRQIRVFISSTLRHMYAERDYLDSSVFPELHERVDHLGLEFFDAALRFWEYIRQWIDSASQNNSP
jgi:hypothetical protein